MDNPKERLMRLAKPEYMKLNVGMAGEPVSTWSSPRVPIGAVSPEVNLVVLPDDPEDRQWEPQLSGLGGVVGDGRTVAKRVAAPVDSEYAVYRVVPGHPKEEEPWHVMEYKFPRGVWYYDQHGVVSARCDDPLVVRAEPGRAFMVATDDPGLVGDASKQVQVNQRARDPSGRVSSSTHAVFVADYAGGATASRRVSGLEVAAYCVEDKNPGKDDAVFVQDEVAANRVENSGKDDAVFVQEYRVVNAAGAGVHLRIAAVDAVVIGGVTGDGWVAAGSLVVTKEGSAAMGVEPLDGVIDLVVGLFEDRVVGSGPHWVTFSVSSVVDEFGYDGGGLSPGDTQWPSRLVASDGQRGLGHTQHCHRWHERGGFDVLKFDLDGTDSECEEQVG